MVSPDFLQAAVGTILLCAALAKWLFRQSVEPFLGALGMPIGISRHVARLVPALECGVGLLLLASRGGLVMPTLAVCTTTMFLVVQVYAGLRKVGIACRCFGPLDGHDMSVFAASRAGSMALVSMILLAMRAADESTAASWAVPSLTAVGALAGLGWLALFALIEQVADFEERRPRAWLMPAEAAHTDPIGLVTLHPRITKAPLGAEG